MTEIAICERLVLVFRMAFGDQIHCPRRRPQAPCLAQVCCSASVCCVIGRAATSFVSAHLEMRLEVKPVGAAPGEAVVLRILEKAQAGDAKACRPTQALASRAIVGACR